MAKRHADDLDTPTLGIIQLVDATSMYHEHLMRGPVQPTTLSLQMTSDGDALGLRVVAPDAWTAAAAVVRRWVAPYHRACASLPLADEYRELHDAAEVEVARRAAMVNAAPYATLEVPCHACKHPHIVTHELHTSMRSGEGHCVEISMPVPTHVLLPGAAVILRVTVDGVRVALRIPAAGHIHSTSCNHKRIDEGTVWVAAYAGDLVALDAALAAGGSTEEFRVVRIDGGRRTCVRPASVPPLDTSLDEHCRPWQASPHFVRQQGEGTQRPYASC